MNNEWMSGGDPISITRQTGHLAPEDLTKRISTIIDELSKTFSLDVKWHEPSRAFLFGAKSGIAKGVNGHLQIQHGAIALLVRLPYLLQVQKTSVEAQINQALDTALR